MSNVALTSTVNWSNNAIHGVYFGSITDDTINGNDSADIIVSNVGPDSDDTINAKAGHDWISVLDFAGGIRWILAVRPTTRSSTTRAIR